MQCCIYGVPIVPIIYIYIYIALSLGPVVSWLIVSIRLLIDRMYNKSDAPFDNPREFQHPKWTATPANPAGTAVVTEPSRQDEYLPQQAMKSSQTPPAFSSHARASQSFKNNIHCQSCTQYTRPPNNLYVVIVTGNCQKHVVCDRVTTGTPINSSQTVL